MYMRYSKVVRCGSIKKWYVFSKSQFLACFSQLFRYPLQRLNLPLYGRGLCHIKNSLWTGFYMVGASAIKELFFLFIHDCDIRLNREYNNIYIKQVKKEVNLIY